MNSNHSSQISQSEQIIQQLMTQTQQGTQNYQQLLQQEQEHAAKLQELSQHSNKAIQMIQQALQGHQTAMQQLQQVSQLIRQLEQIPQTAGYNTGGIQRFNTEQQGFNTGIPSFSTGNSGNQSFSTGSGGYNSSFSPSFTSNSQPVNSLHSPINASINSSFSPQPLHTPMQTNHSYGSMMNQGRSFQQ